MGACATRKAWPFCKLFEDLDGQRFATRIERIRANRFTRTDSQKKPYSRSVRAIRANWLKPAIGNFLVSRDMIRKGGGSVREPSGDSCESRDSRVSANRFARIGPSKRTLVIPEGPTIKKIQSRSKFSIPIEICNLARKFQSRGLDFPTENGAAVGGSLENFILARNFQSRSKSRIFLIFGPSGIPPPLHTCNMTEAESHPACSGGSEQERATLRGGSGAFT